MSEPLKIRFATDVSSAKAGLTDLAASVVTNVGLVSAALNKGAQAQGGYGQAVAKVARAVGDDYAAMTAAGLKAANDSQGNAVAIAGAVARAAGETNVASAAITTSIATGTAAAQFKLALLRTTMAQTMAAVMATPAGAAGVSALAGLVALVALLKLADHAASTAADRMQGLVDLATKAGEAGVGTTLFQAWLGQAKELGAEAKTLEAMLLRAREAATVTLGRDGAAATSPIRSALADHVSAGNLGAGALARYDAAGDQEQRIRVMLDLVQELLAANRQLAAFDLGKTMFGGEFEAKLREGGAVIEAMRRSLDGMRAAGGERIVSPEEIETARRVNAELEKSRAVLAEALAPLQKDIADYQNRQLLAWSEWIASVNRASAVVLSLYGYLKQVGEAVTALGNWSGWDRLFEGLKAMGLAGNWGGTGTGVVDLTDEDRRKAREATEGKPLSVSIVPRGDRSNPLPASPGRASRGAAEAQDPIETLIAGLEKSTAALKAEMEAYHLSNAEKRTAIELAKAEEVAKAKGVTLTGEQTARIRAAAAAAAGYRDKLADLEQAERQLAETARHFGQALSDAFADAILEGRSFGDVLRSLEKQIARATLQAVFTGQGPMAGLLGTAPAASAGSNAVGGLTGTVSGLLKDLFTRTTATGGDVIGPDGALWLAGGGPVRGPGSGTSDSVPALLSNGEFVVNARSASAHAGLLEQINRGGVRRLAQGGWAGRSLAAIGERVLPGGATGPAAGGAAWAEDAGSGSGRSPPARPVQVTFTVQSPDAPSFLRAEAQLTAALARAVQRGTRGL
ncbi:MULTISPECIES: hypothetical protein [Methylobacterium]|jgi:hypothetical protein|uniref:hypothetical protein n=2 Tax=Methylobacteriaceae TaxID=119045 RepID=UPI0008E5D7B7|nr:MULTISPECIES: hypothetical protein [Methylobacterium]MBK3399410.1 hypothetical protein [Methylobacterium ajmalii]MBK3412583.1 hypothetical protein [Methylobacterium ajmalii]MBZ6416008.1 hypothetical protein [Methylobacterium sp.]SFF64174.1 hypothetical protein SAMN04487844_13372 [Methylobacterium sp. yr596]